MIISSCKEKKFYIKITTEGCSMYLVMSVMTCVSCTLLYWVFLVVTVRYLSSQL